MKYILIIALLNVTGCCIGSGEVGWHRGFLSDVSQAGWFCKTFEGQVMSGTGNSSVHYNFTIESKEVFDKLQKAQDAGQEVNLHYYSPRVVSLCKSAHSNIVDDVKVVTQ